MFTRGQWTRRYICGGLDQLFDHDEATWTDKSDVDIDVDHSALDNYAGGCSNVTIMVTLA